MADLAPPLPRSVVQPLESTRPTACIPNHAAGTARVCGCFGLKGIHLLVELPAIGGRSYFDMLSLSPPWLRWNDLARASYMQRLPATSTSGRGLRRRTSFRRGVDVRPGHSVPPNSGGGVSRRCE